MQAANIQGRRRRSPLLELLEDRIALRAELLLDYSRAGSSTYHFVDVVKDQAILTVEAGVNDTPDGLAWDADTFVANGRAVDKLIQDPFVWGQHGGWPDGPHLHAVGSDFYFAAEIRARNNPDAFTEQVWKTDLTPRGTSRSSFEALQAADSRVVRAEPFGFSPTIAKTIQSEDFVDSDGQIRPVVNTTHGRYFSRSRIEGQGRVLQIFRLDDDGQPPQLLLETEPMSAMSPGGAATPSYNRIAANTKARHEPTIPIDLVAYDDVLYFLGTDDEHGIEIWRSDGSSEGTYLLVDLNSGRSSGSPRILANGNGKLFVLANTEAHGSEVWIVTPSGEKEVMDIRPGAASSNVALLGYRQDALYVAADDGVHGYEVWEIQADGAMHLHDIYPGANSSNPTFGRLAYDELAGHLQGDIYFAADDGSHGRELWTIDEQSVRLSQDIHAGPNGSDPVVLAELSDALLFEANDGNHGRELWSITAHPPGDANGDGVTSFADFLILSAHFGQTSDQGAKAGDFDGDGLVSLADFLILSSNFGKSS